MASQELLSRTPEPGVALLTINRPGQLNAITMALQEQLDLALTDLESDPDMGCVVVTGAGERAFSAGYDVHEMAEWPAAELERSLRRREAWIEHLATTPVPLIAALGGIAYGWGAIAATAADIRVGCEETVLRFTAASYGGANATWSLPSIVGRGRAAEILMTARDVGAEEAREIGLLNRVVDASELLDEAIATARQIAQNPPAGPRAIKSLLGEHEGRSQSERLEAENRAMRTELSPGPISELFTDFLEEPGPT